ncbi:MAG: hypothetical protein OXG82_00315 [Gammaproteobacteria bacterium]|nr:hypothetical protein [Gammaproteobacteria bacterium]
MSMTTDEKFMAMFREAKAAFDEEYPPGSPRRERIEAEFARMEAKWDAIDRMEKLARGAEKAVRLFKTLRRGRG